MNDLAAHSTARRIFVDSDPDLSKGCGYWLRPAVGGVQRGRFLRQKPVSRSSCTTAGVTVHEKIQSSGGSSRHRASWLMEEGSGEKEAEERRG